MDWPFRYYPRGRGHRVLIGFAEISGHGADHWVIPRVYVIDGGVLRHADRDEHAQIALGLQMAYGGKIGRAWRQSLEVLHDTH